MRNAGYAEDRLATVETLPVWSDKDIGLPRNGPNNTNSRVTERHQPLVSAPRWVKLNALVFNIFIDVFIDSGIPRASVKESSVGS